MCALGAAVRFGAATVSQAMAARAAAPGPDGGAALFPRTVRQWGFVAGLAPDGVRFLVRVAASRSLPILAFGAALASSLVVTAVAGRLPGRGCRGRPALTSTLRRGSVTAATTRQW